uniref:GTP cyclohydrolase 1 feedback regulatory protein n=1 Tax=Oryzias sinensis TaxID=183150 RepID=A0A8C8DLI8_9TELE
MQHALLVHFQHLFLFCCKVCNHCWQETGPTNVGDEFSDPAVMNYLGARKTTVLGNNFSEYHVEEPPRLVLDKLEKIGFRVLSMTGVGQTLVWCLHKEAE